MRREPDRLAHESFDLAVVGGGILGAFVAWKASSAGLNVALVEKADFASGTTSASGKVLHGGLRYISGGRIPLTFRALRDQDYVRKLAPRLVRPLSFLVPEADSGLGERIGLRAGAGIWRFVTRFGPGDESLPPARYVGASTIEASHPELGGGIGGALQFYDYQIRSPERLTVSVVAAAAKTGAAVANYARAVSLKRSAGTVDGFVVRDDLAGGEFDVRARLIVNATGSWVPDLLGGTSLERPAMAFAKGVHVVLDREEPETALALPIRGAGGTDGGTAESRRIFVSPWEGRTLVGASYSPFDEGPDDCVPSRRDAVDLLESVDAEWPQLQLLDSDIAFAYAGLYPVFGRSRAPSDRYGASLHPLVIDHAETDGISGLLSVVATKLTTAPTLSERVLGAVSERLNTPVQTPARSNPEPLRLARPTPLDGVGSVDAHSISSKPLLERMVTAAVEKEMCRRLPDFFFRRTWIGHLGTPGEPVLERVARTMGALLGWERDRIESEKRLVRERYVSSRPDVRPA